MNLLQIYYWVGWWKKLENSLIVSEVMTKSLVFCFFDSLCTCIFNWLIDRTFFLRIMVSGSLRLLQFCVIFLELLSWRGLSAIMADWYNSSTCGILHIDIYIWNNCYSCIAATVLVSSLTSILGKSQVNCSWLLDLRKLFFDVQNWWLKSVYGTIVAINVLEKFHIQR